MTGDRRCVRFKFFAISLSYFVVSRIIAGIMSKRGRADSRSRTPARVTTRPKSSHGAGSWLESKVPTPELFPPPPPLPIDNTASTASASNLSGAALPQGIIQSSTGPNDSWIVFVNGKWTEINTSLYCTMCNAQVEYSTLPTHLGGQKHKKKLENLEWKPSDAPELKREQFVPPKLDSQPAQFLSGGFLFAGSNVGATSSRSFAAPLDKELLGPPKPITRYEATEKGLVPILSETVLLNPLPVLPPPTVAFPMAKPTVGPVPESTMLVDKATLKELMQDMQKEISAEKSSSSSSSTVAVSSIVPQPTLLAVQTALVSPEIKDMVRQQVIGVLGDFVLQSMGVDIRNPRVPPRPPPPPSITVISKVAPDQVQLK